MRSRILSIVLVAVIATGPMLGSVAQAQTRAKPAKVQLEIPHCVRPIGTVAVVEPKIEAGVQPWWTGMSLGSPEVVLKAYIAESNCFKLVNRGRGMETAERERAMAAAGVLRPRSNIGGGQVTAADYVLFRTCCPATATRAAVPLRAFWAPWLAASSARFLVGFRLPVALRTY